MLRATFGPAALQGRSGFGGRCCDIDRRDDGTEKEEKIEPSCSTPTIGGLESCLKSKHPV